MDMREQNVPFLFLPVTAAKAGFLPSASTFTLSPSSSSSSPSVKLAGVTGVAMFPLRDRLDVEPIGVDVVESPVAELAGVGRDTRGAERRGGMIQPYSDSWNLCGELQRTIEAGRRRIH